METLTEKRPTQNHLLRTLGTFSAIMIVVSAMVGSGVFKKVAPMSAELGASGWVLTAWVLAGVVTLCGALTNAEVAGLIAEPGGQYKYFERMYGRFFAFLYGWTNFSVIGSATIASVAYVFAQSLNSLVPLPTLPADVQSIPLFGLLPFENFGVKAVAIGLVLLLTSINIRGVKYGSNLSNILSASVILAIVLIIVLSFGLGSGQILSFSTAVP